jgi:hypothetical protein
MSATKSKALATWLALVFGTLGAHRFYLHGSNDRWAWLHPMLALPGLIGMRRMSELGQDDHLAWLLIPLLGLSLVAATLAGIVYGLSSDEIWNARHNPNATADQGGWAAILGVVFCLLVGGTVLMATLAFSAQRYFEWQQGDEISTGRS